jgi:hypothetical protein
MQRRIERPMTGDQLTAYEDFSSMIMSAGFGVAVVSYLLGLYFLPRNPVSLGKAA